jgi:hypothetical protein
MDGTLPCPEDIAVKLAGLKMQFEFGDIGTVKIDELVYVAATLLANSSSERSIPIPLLPFRDEAYWKEGIREAHSALLGTEEDFAQIAYIDIAATLPHYGCNLFHDLELHEKVHTFPIIPMSDSMR